MGLHIKMHDKIVGFDDNNNQIIDHIIPLRSKYSLNGTDRLCYKDVRVIYQEIIKERGDSPMPTIAEQLREEGRQQGIEIGIERGIEQGPP